MLEEIHQQFPLFSELSGKQFKKFISTLSSHQYRAGDRIVRQGDKCVNVFLLVQGRIEVYSNSDKGNEAHIVFHRSPSIFGVIEIWKELPYLGTVVALEPTTILTMTKAQYLSLLHNSHQACLTIIQFLSNQVYQGGIDHRVHLFGDTEHVMSRFLICQGEACGEMVHGGVFLPSAINKSEMAKALGVSRRHIIRCFKNLEGSHLIEVQQGHIFIPDLNKLKAYADSVWKVQEKHRVKTK